jgi:outer membrane immunogenic protein
VKKFLLAATAFTTIGGSALAADLAVRRAAPVYAPVPVPIFTWTGCYVGGNGGGLWARSDWDNTVFGSNDSGTASGGVGGVQGGCNYQVGPWVFGIQGDYDWTNASRDENSTLLTNTFGQPITEHVKIDSLASVTGRVGYAWDRFLLYGKGGGAWVKGSHSFLVGGLSVASDSSSRSGWTVGGGGEYAFTNWLTGFVEYDYYRFTDNNPAALICTAVACGGVFFNGDITTNINVVKAGLNLKFGPGGIWW